jgi:hypothetical protein
MDELTNTSATFEFDADEWYQASRAVTNATVWRWLIPLGGIALPAVMIGANLLPHWRRMSAASIVANTAPWILLAAFYLAYMPRLQKQAALKAQVNDPSLRGIQGRAVNEQGLQLSGASFQQSIAWADLVRAVETPSFFLFFYNKRCAHFIPKRALPGAGIQRVRTLVTERMGERARLLG